MFFHHVHDARESCFSAETFNQCRKWTSRDYYAIKIVVGCGPVWWGYVTRSYFRIGQETCLKVRIRCKSCQLQDIYHLSTIIIYRCLNALFSISLRIRDLQTFLVWTKLLQILSATTFIRHISRYLFLFTSYSKNKTGQNILTANFCFVWK